MFRKYNFEKGLKFSIRKFSVGIASVAIGSLLFISPQVLADETTSVTSATTPTGVTATDANLVNLTIQLLLPLIGVQLALKEVI